MNVNSEFPLRYNLALSGSSTLDWIATKLPSGTLAKSASINAIVAYVLKIVNGAPAGPVSPVAP
ncbi:hypothetical protein TL18_08365 [Methanobrevibacter sp. YE315]|nr:hypothetical protein TL18_08365 [Methanobrevibacter sp. YE315]